MTTEIFEQRAIVREGYQILLRAEAELLLPEGKPKIGEFYKRTAHACLTWAKEIYGEKLRREYLELESTREKSQFITQRYQMRMKSPWADTEHLVLLCESTLTGQWNNPERRYFRISHVWKLDEELMLPFSQIMEAFGMQVDRRQLPFRPDGIYPEGNEIVFFRNAGEKNKFLECRLPRPSVK